MRVIKFRAWDVKDAMMYYDIQTGIVFEDGSRYTFDRFICPPSDDDYHDWKWMQWTGLYDKNGKEIYEGDVFKDPIKINQSLYGDWAIYEFIIKSGLTIISYVRSEKDAGIPRGYLASPYIEKFDVDMKTIMFAAHVTLNDCEIIGDIYRNPELIKA